MRHTDPIVVDLLRPPQCSQNPPNYSGTLSVPDRPSHSSWIRRVGLGKAHTFLSMYLVPSPPAILANVKSVAVSPSLSSNPCAAGVQPLGACHWTYPTAERLSVTCQSFHRSSAVMGVEWTRYVDRQGCVSWRRQGWLCNHRRCCTRCKGDQSHGRGGASRNLARLSIDMHIGHAVWDLR